MNAIGDMKGLGVQNLLGGYNLIVSVILPTYNESDNLRVIVPMISGVFERENIRGEIIVVDDNSPDGTAREARLLEEKFPVMVHLREGERGLATAVIKGFGFSKGDICVVMDADMSHPVEKIPEMINPIIRGECDATVGSRYTCGGGCDDWPIRRKFISKTAGILARGLVKLSDPTSGFMAIRRKLLESVKLDPIGWKIVLEVIVKTKARFREVPIVFAERQFGRSKLNMKVQKEYLLHLLRLYYFKYGNFAQIFKKSSG